MRIPKQETERFALSLEGSLNRNGHPKTAGCLDGASHTGWFGGLGDFGYFWELLTNQTRSRDLAIPPGGRRSSNRVAADKDDPQQRQVDTNWEWFTSTTSHGLFGFWFNFVNSECFAGIRQISDMTGEWPKEPGFMSKWGTKILSGRVDKTSDYLPHPFSRVIESYIYIYTHI